MSLSDLKTMADALVNQGTNALNAQLSYLDSLADAEKTIVQQQADLLREKTDMLDAAHGEEGQTYSPIQDLIQNARQMIDGLFRSTNPLGGGGASGGAGASGSWGDPELIGINQYTGNCENPVLLKSLIRTKFFNDDMLLMWVSIYDVFGGYMELSLNPVTTTVDRCGVPTTYTYNDEIISAFTRFYLYSDGYRYYEVIATGDDKPESRDILETYNQNYEYASRDELVCEDVPAYYNDCTPTGNIIDIYDTTSPVKRLTLRDVETIYWQDTGYAYAQYYKWSVWGECSLTSVDVFWGRPASVVVGGSILGILTAGYVLLSSLSGLNLDRTEDEE